MVSEPCLAKRFLIEFWLPSVRTWEGCILVRPVLHSGLLVSLHMRENVGANFIYIVGHIFQM